MKKIKSKKRWCCSIHGWQPKPDSYFLDMDEIENLNTMIKAITNLLKQKEKQNSLTTEKELNEEN